MMATTKKEDLYSYKANVCRVVDGDTVDLLLDLGFHISYALRVRLAAIDAPELHSKDAAERETANRAKSRLMEMLPVGSSVFVSTVKDSQEKYGRYLAAITNEKGLVVNEALVDEGLAKFYDGGKR